jgi:flagellar biosynthesis regulator FlaF
VSNDSHNLLGGGRAFDAGLEAEATALAKAARLLAEARDRWDESGHDSRLDFAVRYNHRLWALFVNELETDGHELIPGLRREILRLAEQVEAHTQDALERPAREHLQFLIDIDDQASRGLTRVDS